MDEVTRYRLCHLSMSGIVCSQEAVGLRCKACLAGQLTNAVLAAGLSRNTQVVVMPQAPLWLDLQVGLRTLATVFPDEEFLLGCLRADSVEGGTG